MLPPTEDIFGHRASEYAVNHDLELGPRLGFGKDGYVYSTTGAAGGPTAIKVFGNERAYQQELACYRRLREHSVTAVQGLHVPQLIDSDDRLFVIEMTIVRPPFLLDFASALLDPPPEFPEEVQQQWHEEKEEQFGKRWQDVQLILATLQGRYGIYFLDVTPRNIRFEDE